MGGSDDLFILKATLLLRGCPVPFCEGGHKQEDLPLHCVNWWRDQGWARMGWKGSRQNADSAVIKAKINNFRKNFHKRKREANSQVVEQQEQRLKLTGQTCEVERADVDSGNSHQGSESSCFNCSYIGILSSHLRDAHLCLNAHLKKYLGHRADKYREKKQLAIFDLGLVSDFCVNPDCDIDSARGGIICQSHVEGPCKKFYQREGERVLNWGQGLSGQAIQLKLSNRKKQITRNRTDEPNIVKYHEGMAGILNFVCEKCGIQGPLLDSRDHRIYVPPSFDPPQCMQCMNDAFRGQELMQEALELLGQLGSPGEQGEDSLKMVIVEGDHGEDPRVVFVPAIFNVECQSASINDVELNPISTSILVPKNPEALTVIGDDTSEQAKLAKVALEKVAEFYGKRHFLGPLKETFSLLFNLMLARIRAAQLGMLARQKGKGKGVITSREPQKATVKARNPHFEETKKFCHGKICSWSATAQDQRSKERRARCNINGQLRLKVEVTLIKKMATDSPLLQAIIGKSLSSVHPPRSLAALAPLVLNYVKAKTNLLITNIIAPNYSNWDLEIVFEGKEWTVHWVGNLYLQEFDDLNQKIGRGEVSETELAAEVRKCQNILPLTTVSRRKLEGYSNITEERAEVLEQLARDHQMRGKPRPLSLLTMFTPSGIQVSDEERFLRERAVQLGETRGLEVECVDAVVEIVEVLLNEGLNSIAFEADDARRLRDDLRPFLNQDLEINKALLLYHILIWKTGGEGVWTMARDPGEMRVEGYLPNILDACGLPMSAEICSSDGDFSLPQDEALGEDLTRLLMAEEADEVSENSCIEDWQEISLLNFVNSTLPPDKVATLRGSSSQPVVPVVTSKDRVLTWRKALDSDNHSGDSVFEVDGSESMFVRSNTDVRVVFEKLPESMKIMCLAQLLKEYHLLHPSKNGYEKARSSIDEETQVGPDSNGLIAGTDVAAPQTIKLTDGRIMKRRCRGAFAVPLLLHSGTISKHGNQLLFQPWRYLEDVSGIQDEEETQSQRNRRLQIFPSSLIPFADDGDEDDDD